ncbi:MAG TPA: methyltransferase [Micropepsaceae bacterium]|nr:methyltransferase [Micropepsaceae bacterium]
MPKIKRAPITKSRGKDSLTADELMTVMQGHVAFQLLWAGHKLGLLALLSTKPGSTQSAIAKKLGLAPRPARILLVGLTALRIIRKIGEGYANAGVTEKWLVPDRPRSFANVLGWQAEIVYPGLFDFVESLTKNKNLGLARFPGPGKELYERLTAQPRLEKVFQDSMSALSNQANVELLANLPLKNSKHLIDMGGGAGTNAMAIARKFPHLHVTVFDQPTVCKIARRNIKRAGLSDRISTWPGDLFATPLPSGVDTIIFCHMFTIWSPERAMELLRKSYKALPKGGKLLIFNMMGNDDDTGPISTALGSPYFLAIATGEGMLYSWKDHETRIRKAGFKKMERISDLPLDHGLLVATK